MNLKVLIGLIPISSMRKKILLFKSSLGSLVFMDFGLLARNIVGCKLVCH